jgi:hypothetical protein
MTNDIKQMELWQTDTPGIEYDRVLPPVALDGFREVSQDEFYQIVGPLDAVVSAVGQFPYTSEFKIRYGKLIGKAVDSYGFEYGKYVVTRYYISCNWR